MRHIKIGPVFLKTKMHNARLISQLLQVAIEREKEVLNIICMLKSII